MGRVWTGRAARSVARTVVWSAALIASFAAGCGTMTSPAQLAIGPELHADSSPPSGQWVGERDGRTDVPRAPSPQYEERQLPETIHPIYADTVSGEPPQRGPLQFGFTGSYLYGRASGSVQIPLGGRGGTSADRPTFKEMGFDTVSMPDGEVTVGFAPNQEIFAGAEIIRLSGSSTLTKNLITHGITFPSGTHVSSDLQLDWYRVGYRVGFPIIQAANGEPELMLTPYIDAVFWDFSYDLSAHGIRKASRAFTKIGAQVGGNVTWRPGGGPFSLEAGAASFPQVSSWPQISVEHVLARYRFLEWRRFDFTIHVGAEWEQQDFKDNQRTSNHVKADFSPMLITGLGVSF